MEHILVDLATLPEVYQTRLPNGQIVTEKRPVYNLLADGFYGVGAGATLFEEGAIIVAPDSKPNTSMQPLNRAAGEAFNAWAESLPMEGGVTVSIEELSEAAAALANDPDVKKLPHDKAASIVYKFAARLKAQREGKKLGQASIDPAFGRLGDKAAPPLLGASVKDPLNNMRRDRGPAVPGSIQRAGTAA